MLKLYKKLAEDIMFVKFMNETPSEIEVDNKIPT